jgi:heat shock protein HslJ
VDLTPDGRPGRHRDGGRLGLRKLWSLEPIACCFAGAECVGGADRARGATWVVSTIGDNDTIADSRPTMTFGADGQVQGTGGCNSYGGPYKPDGATIDIGDLASTMMLCADQSIGAQETAFFTALSDAQTWQIDEAGDLVLAGVARIVAKSAAAEPSGSAATGLVGAWNLAEMVRPRTSRTCSRRSRSPRTAACQDSRGATRSAGRIRRMARRSRGVRSRPRRWAASGREARSNPII